MRLLFVENRYATWLWSHVARRLQADGHEIHWLVQNPRFAPAFGRVHVLPFPGAHDEGDVAAVEAHPLLRRDRSRRFFGVTARTQGVYWSRIAAALDAVAPDVVFGEPTQFHELITVELARRRGIPFFYSSATRYPTGRVTFYQYDTIEPFGGSGERLSDDAAANLREAIVARRVLPSYMQSRPVGRLRRQARAWGDRARITAGWLAGERFVTPSPLRKARLEAARRERVRTWESFAVSALPPALDTLPWALYAMQMQPESNIDVWGAPWSDQVRIVREAADALAAIGGVLVVKPNPKSKYEIDTALCELARVHPAIVALAHATRMGDFFERVPVVMGVTGTVTMEALMAGKPVGMLGRHRMARLDGATRLARPADVAALARAARDGTARRASPEEASALLSQLNAESYPGTMFDPLNQPEYATVQNIGDLADAFRDVLARVPTEWVAQRDAIHALRDAIVFDCV